MIEGEMLADVSSEEGGIPPEVWNFSVNQEAMKAYTTKPPPKASVANSRANRTTVGRDGPKLVRAPKP